MSLPPDPEKPGNLWCEDCQQSVAPRRAAAHLESKKHTSRLAGAAKPVPDKVGTSAEAPIAAAKPSKAAMGTEAAEKKGTEAAEKKGPARRTAPRGSELTADPEKPGHRWCGICQVSLKPAQAESHLGTARHADNAAKHLMHAMKATKVSDK